MKRMGIAPPEDHWQDWILRTRLGPTVCAGEAISPLISNTVHTFPIYAQFSAPYPEPERRNVPCGITV